MMHQPKGLYEKYFKRLLDFILSLCALLVLSPLLLVLSALGLVKMKGNPFFSQERPGWHEKIFLLYKFRTMTNEKDQNGELLPDEKRLIPYGRFLRSTSLDELPEIWNILKGDMSIIGPRPLLVRYLPYYTEEERKRHWVRPGLTGLAQIHGRNYLKWDKRLALDVQYVDNVSFRMDLKIFLETVSKVIKRDGVATDTDTVETFLDEERS